MGIEKDWKIVLYSLLVNTLWIFSIISPTRSRPQRTAPSHNQWSAIYSFGRSLCIVLYTYLLFVYIRWRYTIYDNDTYIVYRIYDIHDYDSYIHDYNLSSNDPDLSRRKIYECNERPLLYRHYRNNVSDYITEITVLYYSKKLHYFNTAKY